MKAEAQARKEIEVKVANWLDLHIGVYFSHTVYREQETLGEYLRQSIRSLMPDDWINHLAGH